MANAALDVDVGAMEAFVAAQELSSSVRSITIQIIEEKLCLTGQSTVGGRAEEDFTAIVEGMEADQAYFLLFCTSEAQDTVFTARKQWCLFSLVPDSLRQVRQKMLYSSARMPMKNALGSAFFTSEFVANDKADLTWDHYMNYNQGNKGNDRSTLLSAAEAAINSEKCMEDEAATTKSSGTTMLPFEATQDVHAALQAFVQGGAQLVEVELVADEESFSLKKSLECIDAGDFSKDVDDDGAVFALVQHNGASVLIFVVADDVPVKTKVKMASAKSTFTSICATAGISFARTIEVSEASHIMTLLAPQEDTVGTAPTSTTQTRIKAPGRSSKTQNRRRFSATTAQADS